MGGGGGTYCPLQRSRRPVSSGGLAPASPQPITLTLTLTPLTNPHPLPSPPPPLLHLVPRFSAGAPYEDIAFKVVNKEWEYGHKRGFKSTCERGILHVYFNFKRSRYRR